MKTNFSQTLLTILFLFEISIFTNAQTPQWELLGLENEIIFDIVIDDSSNVYAGCESGVFKSTDNGSSWISKNNGLEDILGVKKLFIDYNGNILLAATGMFHDGLYKSTTGGENWIRMVDTLGISENDFDDVVVIPNEPGGIIYVGSNLDGVFRSTDNGTTWQVTNFSDPGATDIGINTNGYMFFANNTASWFGIYRSTDMGLNWVRHTLLGAESIVYLRDGSMLAGCFEVGSGTSGIYKSIDDGNSWFNTNTFSGLDFFSDFVLDTNNDVYVAIISRGVYLTTNNGISWSNYGLSNPSFAITTLAIDSLGYIWAGTNMNGLYRTEGRTVPVELVSFSAELKTESVILSWITGSEINNQGFEIERNQRSKIKGQNGWEKIGFVDGYGTTTQTKIYSFIDENISSGIYQYRLKQIDYDGTFDYSKVIEVEIGIPDEFSLSQNYPNPFNPGTKIKYQIPHKGFVTLRAFDVLGKEIVTLVNEEKPAGSYEVEFDGSNLSSGVYYYKMQAGEFVDTRKMVLVK